MPSVILFGPTASHNQERLQRLLGTSWRTVAIPNDLDHSMLLEALPEADAFIGLSWRAAWTTSARRLRLIQALGAGVDAYDLASLPPGCTLCNAYEHGVPVAEYVMGAIAALSIGFAKYDRSLRAGRWDGSGRLDGEPHPELAGQTVGVIGWGAIGREVALRAKAFEMKVYAVRANPESFDSSPHPDWRGGPADIEKLLAESDFVVVCCPLNEQTRSMLDRSRLSLLKPTAILINVARAEIIDEQALFEILVSGRIAGAALDVWYQYPDSKDDHQFPSRLPFHELQNVLMTPHLSAWTEAMIERRWRVIAANLDALAEGSPFNNVVIRKEKL